MTPLVTILNILPQLSSNVATAGWPCGWSDCVAILLVVEFVRKDLEEVARIERRQQIAAYAAAVAGTTDDLDKDLEASAVDAWRDLE